VLVTRPKFGSCTFVLPGLNRERLKALNISQRRSRRTDSVNGKDFAREKLSSSSQG
jgi:hypothetical protein